MNRTCKENAKKPCGGFSLFEMLIVISIISILLVIILSTYSNLARRGRDQKRQADITKLQSALERYHAGHVLSGGYPRGAGNTSASLIVLGTGRYVDELPTDPMDGTYNYYYLSVSGEKYILCAHLENGDSSDGCGGSNNCGDVCNYEVTGSYKAGR